MEKTKEVTAAVASYVILALMKNPGKVSAILS
jgi:hypothetical protein